MKTLNIIKCILFFLVLSGTGAYAQNIAAWSVIEYDSIAPASVVTKGTRLAYSKKYNSFYRWDVICSCWKRFAGPGITDTTYSLSFSSPNLELVGSGSTVSLTDLYTAGYGLIKTAEAWRADTTSPNGLATRLFAKTLPTSITIDQIAYSNGTNLVGSPLLRFSSGKTFFGSASDVTAQTNLLNLSVGSSGAATSYIAFNRISGTNAGYNIGIINGGNFDIQRSGDSQPTFSIGNTATGDQSKTVNIGSGNGSLSATLNIHNRVPGGTSMPLILFNGQTSVNSNTSIGFGSTASSGALYPYAKVEGLRTATAGLPSNSTGGLGFYYTNNSASFSEGFRLHSTGNLLIGTTTDIPTSILTARSTTKSVSPFPLHTLAESDAITGVQGNFDYETTQNGLRWYNGTRKAYALESTFARGTATRVPFFDANGQVTDNDNLRLVSGKLFVGATADVTAQANLINMSLGSSGGASSYISFDRSSGTNSEYNFGFVSGAEFGIFRIGDGAYTFGIQNNAVGDPKVIYFGSLNGTIDATLKVHNSVGAASTDALTLGNNSTSVGSNVSMLFNSVSNAGIEYSYARIQGIKTASALTTANATGGITFSTKNNSGTFSEGFRLEPNGFLGVGTSLPLRQLHVAQDIIVGDSTRLATTPTHTAITGLLTRDATGWVGLATLGSGLSYSGGVFSNSRESIYNLLPSGSVRVDANANTLTLDSLTRLNISSPNHTSEFGNASIAQIKKLNAGGTKYYDSYYQYDSRNSIANGTNVAVGPAYSRLFVFNQGAGEQYEWTDMHILDTTNTVFGHMYGARYYAGLNTFRSQRPTSGSAYRLTPGFDFFEVGSGNQSSWTPHTTWRKGADTLMQLKEDGLLQLQEYTYAAPFTALTVGEDATDLFLTTTSTTGKVIGKAMRQTTNVKDADLTVTDDMLDLSIDIHVWAYCSNAASDSVVIDLPTPGLDYIGQKVSVYGDGRNATINRDVYVRCVGAKLWHGVSAPTAETYYQVTSLGLARNSSTAEFICIQNPDDNLYYWQLVQHHEQ